MNILLWQYFTVFTVLIIAVVAIVCYGVLGSAYTSQAKTRIESIGVDLSRIIDERPTSPAYVEERMRHYALSDGVDVFLVSPTGETVLPTNATVPEDWETLVEDMSSRMSGWERGKAVVYSLDKSLNYAACVTFNNLPHVLLVRYPLSIILQTVHNMQAFIIGIAAGAIVIVFFLSYIVAQKLSRPIKNISTTAKRMASGDYSVQFASAEYQEIAQLSDTLNYVRTEIKKSDDFQKELMANVSHDLRTPLTMIKAYASMIMEISGDDPEKRNKHLQVIIDESDRLTGLVNDILNVSKVSAGLNELNKKVFNLTEFLYGILNRFDYLQETQGYKIYVDIDPNLYTLADEEKIGQVIYNLLSNSVNYTGEDKTVYVSLKDCPEESRIKFSVRDTGKGINDEEMQHIWDRYYRSKDAHARPVKGTGLGLNIVKIILQAHAFDFGVHSTPGEGSTFFVDFPSVPSEPIENYPEPND
ncbi:MAG: sensor histidine kinase [Candidatus Coproplasma sp.]